VEAVTANLVLLGTLAGSFAGLATGIGANPSSISDLGPMLDELQSRAAALTVR
jgi:hypothetical protein